jgi:amidophosphoribosyltransferase
LLREKCGVVGARSISGREVAPSIFYALYSLQHRGQESCGITTYDGEAFHTEKGMGLVPEFFNREKIERLRGGRGIGHVRYSTTGDSASDNAQPFAVLHGKGTLAIAHNGNIVNFDELKKRLEADGQAFVSNTDTEIIAHLIAKEYGRTDDLVAAITEVMKRLIGSYSLALLTDDEVIAVRDPLGIRPLALGGDGDLTVVASESIVFDVLNLPFLRDVRPGEILVIDDDGIQTHRPFKLNRAAHCMFEYVYFARPDSVLDGIPVYRVRERIGEVLAENDNIEADVVIPVPDSAIPSALGYSQARGIPYREGFIRNRYVGRTFILPDQEARRLAVRLKMNPLSRSVEGKRVVLLDDSIVRGTTSTRIIDLLRDEGAEEVHMRVGCPPIKALCKLGIDMPTDQELIASERDVEAVRRTIGADTLHYLPMEGLMEAIGLPEDRLCRGCLTTQYPVDIGRFEQAVLPTFRREKRVERKLVPLGK